MRYVIVGIMAVALALAGLGVWRHRLMFGTPRRTLETMISSESEGDYMRCYSLRSRSLMRKIGGSREPFLFSALTRGDDVMVVSEEVGGANAVLRVRVGEGPPSELRFVREGIGWKFDISDKLSAALRVRLNQS